MFSSTPHFYPLNVSSIRYTCSYDSPDMSPGKPNEPSGGNVSQLRSTTLLKWSKRHRVKIILQNVWAIVFLAAEDKKERNTVKLSDYKKQNQHYMHFLGWDPRTERKEIHFVKVVMLYECWFSSLNVREG